MKPFDTTKKKRRRKKKKNSSASPQPQLIAQEEEDNKDEEEERRRALNCLIEAFSSSSPEEIASAYVAAGCDANKAASILSTDLSEETAAGSAKSPKGGRRQKKNLTVSTGTVSSVLGKGYVWRGNRSNGSVDSKAVSSYPAGRHEDAEDFLFWMLGDECQLNFGVIQDIFCQCGYDVEKALDTLLELSASSNVKFMDNVCGSSSKSSSCDNGFLLEGYSNDLADSITRKCRLTEDSTFFLSENELHEVVESARYDDRDDTKAMFNCDEHLLSKPGVTKSYLPQKVLESLFSIPASSEHKPSSMDWKRVVKKMESFGQELEFCSASIPEATRHHTRDAKVDDYQVLRRAAREHWDTTKSYYQKAAAAFSSGERSHAAYLSEQGRFYHRKARKADEKAGQEIFEARNKGIKNAVTIDLHGQQVKQAIRLVKLHLILFTYIPSIQFLTVITGCGTHGLGRGKIKQSVIDLMKKEGLEWSEENRGTIVIRLDGRKEFGFFQSESDSE